MTRMTEAKRRLEIGEVLILDGAMGTELQNRGIRTDLPLWSAGPIQTHPSDIEAIHLEYILAGANIITTNTFRSNFRTFNRIGKPEEARSRTIKACELAISARNLSKNDEVVVLGSMAPLEDCYRIDLVPDNTALQHEHAIWAKDLFDGGVDAILVETMNCITEAKIAATEVKKLGLDVFISFLSDPCGTLLSGESIDMALQSISDLDPVAVLINCRPPSEVDSALNILLDQAQFPVGVYANGDGKPDDEQGWIFTSSSEEKGFMDYSKDWIRKGVKIIGGCCGTTPSNIKQLSDYVKKNRI